MVEFLFDAAEAYLVFTLILGAVLGVVAVRAWFRDAL